MSIRTELKSAKIAGQKKTMLFLSPLHSPQIIIQHSEDIKKLGKNTTNDTIIPSKEKQENRIME